jgi:hypothetical protein
MSPPPPSCGRCGAPVQEADLESGASVLLFGKVFCPACKKQAIDDVSLEELTEAPAPPPKPAPAPRPAPRVEPAPKPAPNPAAPPPPTRSAPKPEPPPTRSGPRPPTSRHRLPARSKSSRTPLLLGGAAVALVAAVAVAFLAGPPAAPPPPAPGVPAPAPAGADPDAKAKAAWAAVEPLLRRSDVGFDALIAALDRALLDCRGSSYEARVAEAKAKVLKEKEGLDAGRQIVAVLDTMKEISAKDKDFARYAEFAELAQKARDLAARSFPAQLADVNRLQQDYAGRYEKAAEPHFAEIEPAAAGLASEKRYDAALQKIETFPKQFRQSGAWRGLERLKQQIERDRKLAPKK